MTHPLTLRRSLRLLALAVALTLAPSLAAADEPAKKADASATAAPIPAANALDRTEDNTPAPPMEPSVAQAKLLVEALRTGDPAKAEPFFFPQDAFRVLKGIPKPDRYFGRLMKVYHEDIRAMRKQLKDPESVEFVALEANRAKKWIPRGKEGNNYPYWAMYKARLIVRDAGKRRVLKLRVMIHWGDRWYITHLTNK